jgi:hypothetical protein
MYESSILHEKMQTLGTNTAIDTLGTRIIFPIAHFRKPKSKYQFSWQKETQPEFKEKDTIVGRRDNMAFESLGSASCIVNGHLL